LVLYKFLWTKNYFSILDHLHVGHKVVL